MMILRLTWIITIIFFVASCGGMALAPAEKTPASASSTEKRLLQQGEQYYNQDKFKPALQKAQEALEFNPDNVAALFSIATSYLALGELNKSLEFARRASSYKSEYLRDTYLLLGGIYERLDDPWNALRTYRFAAREYPEDSRIQYQLGTSYADLKKPEFAAESLKAAIRLDPDNAEYHFQLGVLYYNNDYPTPALLSLSMALLLEPKKGPVELIRNNIYTLLARTAPTVIKTDEGNFQSAGNALAEQRTSMLSKTSDYTNFEIAKAQYHALLMELDNAAFKQQTRTFVMKCYAPFYNKIFRQGLSEVFAYYIFQSDQDSTIRNWLEDQQEKSKQLGQLIKEYECQ